MVCVLTSIFIYRLLPTLGLIIDRSSDTLPDGDWIENQGFPRWIESLAVSSTVPFRDIQVIYILVLNLNVTCRE